MNRKIHAYAAMLVTATLFCGIPLMSDAQTMRNRTGWGGEFIIFPGDADGKAGDLNIEGQVGYSLYVDGPRANCSVAGGWQGTANIVSGSLPPGLAIDSSFSITGVPTERGHWIVTLKLDPIYCGGASFWGFEQKLYFHIGGSGKVIQ